MGVVPEDEGSDPLSRVDMNRRARKVRFATSTHSTGASIGAYPKP